MPILARGFSDEVSKPPVSAGVRIKLEGKTREQVTNFRNIVE
jgi:hypothetical protein